MNSETIRKAIQNIIVISDFKTKEIEDYWNNELKIINNLNFGLSRDGAITVHYLFTKDGIDEHIYKAVSNKMNFTSTYYRDCI